jgi:hypothetical protein
VIHQAWWPVTDRRWGQKMLQAIINGKAGRIPLGVRPGDSWRQAFRASEDLLTASVFGRLAYLDGGVLWEILRRTFGPEALPSRRVVEIEQIKFWPTWPEAQGRLGQDVEPDVVLTLGVGDPARRVAFIVECKTGGNRQYADQWAREWIAFEAETSVVDPPDEVWLLALGGIPGGASATVLSFTRQIHQNHEITLRALAADWNDLSRALDEVELGSDVAERLIDDIRAALELCGYRTVRPLSELVTYATQYAISSVGERVLEANRQLGRGEPIDTAPREQSFVGLSSLLAWARKFRSNQSSASRLRWTTRGEAR